MCQEVGELDLSGNFGTKRGLTPRRNDRRRKKKKIVYLH